MGVLRCLKGRGVGSSEWDKECVKGPGRGLLGAGYRSRPGTRRRRVGGDDKRDEQRESSGPREQSAPRARTRDARESSPRLSPRYDGYGYSQG
jgi:hypothetical protein